MLRDSAADLVLTNSMRMLGAGRREDVGDLHVFPDVAIQVRAYAGNKIGTAVNSSATDSVRQAQNASLPYGLGLVPIPRAPKNGAVRWLACVEPGQWPTDSSPVAEFAMISKLLTWLRDDTGPHGYIAWPRECRIGALHVGTRVTLVSPIEAWLTAYREATAARHKTDYRQSA